MLTPSSNTVLEPVTIEMLASLADVRVHFTRFRVTRIGLSDDDNDQFDHREMVRAATLLADAKVDVIAWNGTSASWLGFEQDERLCDQIRAECGVGACTSVLALREIFTRTNVRKIGLVTPYTDPVQSRIMSNLTEAGFVCAAERHLDLSDNFSFAEVRSDAIAELVLDVAREDCDAVAIVCTNLNGAAIASDLERRIGRPVYDSIAVTIWKSLQLAGVDVGALGAWGELFRNPILRGRL
jgi:maleate isomerase